MNRDVKRQSAPHAEISFMSRIYYGVDNAFPLCAIAVVKKVVEVCSILFLNMWGGH